MRTRAFLALGALAFAVSGCSGGISTPGEGPTANIPGPDPDRALPADALDPFGPVARAQDGLWDLAFPISVAVGIFVLLGTLFIVVRFRDKGQEQLPKQVHGNTLLEVTWTIIPALILVVIAVPTVQTIFELADEPADDAIHVNVIGKQYWWSFEYVDTGVWTGSELHIPTDREIFITLDGTEPTNSTVYGTDPVMHSFWVPSLAGKRDWIPGTTREMRIQADEPGVYPGNCAEFCGLSHANMRFTVIAHEPAEYEAWIAEQQEAQPDADGSDDLVAQGEQLFQTCLACHNVTGHPLAYDEDDEPLAPPSRVGPDLTYFAQREAFAGYIFDSPFGDAVEDPDQAMQHLRQWLENPASIKPGAQMPANLLQNDEEIDAIIAYLATLE